MNNVEKMYAEVFAILLALGNDYISKIPRDVMKKIINNANMELMPEIDLNKRIEENTNISKEARAFITLLKLKYWCENEAEKEELMQIVKNNSMKKI